MAGTPPDVESPAGRTASEGQRRISRRQVRDFLDSTANREAVDPTAAPSDSEAPDAGDAAAAKLDALATALAAGVASGGSNAPPRADEEARHRLAEALRSAWAARMPTSVHNDPGGEP